MLQALDEAEKAYNEDEIPVGCVIVRDGKVIATAHNTKEKCGCAVFHAEINAIEKACSSLGSWCLAGCEMYVTLEPCTMCAGAILNSRLDKVHIAYKDPKSGAFGSVVNLNSYPLNHKCKLSFGLCKGESKKMMQSFFAAKRKRSIDEK